MERPPSRVENDGDESSVFLSSQESVADKKNEETPKMLSNQKTPVFTKKPLLYSKSMVGNFISWLGLNQEEEEDKGQQWRDLVRRRRMKNMIVGQYKEVPDNDDVSEAFTQTPRSHYHITDPLARPGLNTQLSRVSTMSRRAARTTNVVTIRGGRESVWRMALKGIKTAMTPQVLRDNVHPLHPRSITLHQMKMEQQRSLEPLGNHDDDVFFDVPTPTAIFPTLLLPPSSVYKPYNDVTNNINNNTKNKISNNNNNNITINNVNNDHNSLPTNNNNNAVPSSNSNMQSLSPASPDSSADEVFEGSSGGGGVGSSGGGGQRMSLIERRRNKKPAVIDAVVVGGGDNGRGGGGGGGRGVGGRDGNDGGVIAATTNDAGEVEDDDVFEASTDLHDTNRAAPIDKNQNKNFSKFTFNPPTTTTNTAPIQDIAIPANFDVNDSHQRSTTTTTSNNHAQTSLYDAYLHHQMTSTLYPRQHGIFQPMSKLPPSVLEDFISRQKKPQQEANKRHYYHTHTDTQAYTSVPTDTRRRRGRHIGKSFLQYLADLEYRRSRIDSVVKRQFNSLPDHRPYFTFWCTFVQMVCYLIAVCVHDLAPFGLSYSSITEEVLKPNLAIEESSYIEDNNVWIGLRQADLIHLGARYSGCMKVDELVERQVQRVRLHEAATACCIRLDGSGCYQASEKDCLYPYGMHLSKSSLSRWMTWANGTGPFNRSSGAVCHQDPRFCMKPVLLPGRQQHDWPDDITLWPACKQAYKATDLPSDDDLEHLTCDITGRPCCVGVRGGCVITTREDCVFLRGYYHADAALCSQVDCMQDVCGMVPFLRAKVPDQIYRLVSSLFIHAGVVHLMVTVVFQLTVMRDLEKLAGWLRICIIYVLSGVGGSLFAAILLPHLIEAGPSGSQFGLLSCLFVEVIQNWYILKQPRLALLRLCLLLLVLLLLGLLPMVDNLAHIGGFLIGFMLSFVFLPYISFTLRERRRKLAVVVVCGVLSSLLMLSLVVMFYLPPFIHCSFCHYLNCIPITPTLCSNIAITGSTL